MNYSFEISYDLNTPLDIPVDPYWDNVVLLLRADKGFIDVSNKNHVVYNRNLKLNSVNSKFNNACFDMEAGFIEIKHSNHLNLDDQDFTLEYWVKFQEDLNPYNNWGIFYSKKRTGGNLTTLEKTFDDYSPFYSEFSVTNNKFSGSFSLAGDNIYNSTVTNPNWFNSDIIYENAHNWNHIATNKQGTKVVSYLNGVFLVEMTLNNPKLLSNTMNLAIGALHRDLDPSFSGFKGYIDNFRLTKGVARYTENFEVPTTPFYIG